jgi:hypothetical protein
VRDCPGIGFSIVESIQLKIVLLAPMPSASVRMAMAVKRGSWPACADHTEGLAALFALVGDLVPYGNLTLLQRKFCDLCHKHAERRLLWIGGKACGTKACLHLSAVVCGGTRELETKRGGMAYSCITKSLIPTAATGLFLPRRSLVRRARSGGIVASGCLCIRGNNFWRHTFSSAFPQFDFFALPRIRLQKFRLPYVFL